MKEIKNIRSSFDLQDRGENGWLKWNPWDLLVEGPCQPKPQDEVKPFFKKRQFLIHNKSQKRQMLKVGDKDHKWNKKVLHI